MVAQRGVIWTGVVILLFAASCTVAQPNDSSATDLLDAADGMSDGELLQSAEQRIERFRRSDAVVRVVDRQGRAVPDAVVSVVQTRHAFKFGCNIFMWGRVGSPDDEAAYRRQFAQLLNYATLPYYWASYERRQGSPDHARSRAIAEWCRDNEIDVKGHPLAWNYSDPAWLPDDPNDVRRLQYERIDDCVTRFKGLIDRWDVVNEAAHFERDAFRQQAPKMTEMWEQTGRMEFTRQCFQRACAANPNATLLINDYRTDSRYENVIQELTGPNGRPLYDEIGIQSHMHSGVWTNAKIWERCQQFARYKVPLHFTETTILSGPLGMSRKQEGVDWLTTPAGEEFQAREVRRVYTMIYSHPAVEAITWWDFADRGAWMRVPAGLLRHDMTAKPAYHSLMDLLMKKWRTNANGSTDADGRFSFRGAHGDYRVSVRVRSTKLVAAEMSVERDADNVIVVEVR